MSNPTETTLPPALRTLLEEALNAWAGQFDGPADEDLSVSGADLVEWFADWRLRLRAALTVKAAPPPRVSSPAEQELIGRLLTLAPPPRPEFMTWWSDLNLELTRAGTGHVDFGDARAFYSMFMRLSPAEAAKRVIADRAKKAEG